MVKNKIGGNKAKRIGRKFLNDDSATTAKTRFADVGEIYAVVSKLFGGGMVEATCIDGKIRLCIIRNKFKGRGKRDNMLKVGTWILVGPREYETSREKEKCDLLEVYSEYDKKVLEQNVKTINWMIFKEEDTKNDDYIEFSNGPNYYLNEIEENKEDHGSSGQSDDELDIDIDEI